MNRQGCSPLIKNYTLLSVHLFQYDVTFWVTPADGSTKLIEWITESYWFTTFSCCTL